MDPRRPAARDEEQATLGIIDFGARPATRPASSWTGTDDGRGNAGCRGVAGHRAGIAAVRDVLDASVRLGLEVLTLYAFSRENWSRPAAEINALMGLLRDYLDQELPSLHERTSSFARSGRVDDLTRTVRSRSTGRPLRPPGNTGMAFLVALSYSGRGDITEARGPSRGTRPPGGFHRTRSTN